MFNREQEREKKKWREKRSHEMTTYFEQIFILIDREKKHTKADNDDSSLDYSWGQIKLGNIIHMLFLFTIVEYVEKKG